MCLPVNFEWLSMKWQEGGRGGRWKVEEGGVATCSCLHKAGALYLSFHLPQLTLICARSQANSRASLAPPPPSSRVLRERSKMQSNKQIASRQLWRRETTSTTTDSYACSAFTLPIAAAASNCATVQQQQRCVWQQQQQQQQQWWACWVASNSKRCRP